MNDTTQYGFYRTQSNESYKPFESEEFNYGKKDKHDKDKFCPICLHDYNSHHHKKHCNSGVPIQEGTLVLSVMVFIYLIYKYLRK